MDIRLQQAQDWLGQHFPNQQISLRPLSGDASFRRYFRASIAGKSYALMDAPPAQEDCTSFVAIGRHWKAQGISVPSIFIDDLEAGFLLLEDFGDHTLLARLEELMQQGNPAENDYCEAQYRQAIDILISIQSTASDGENALPPYNEALLRQEIGLFTDWLLEQKLGLSLNSKQEIALNACFDQLTDNALSQPLVVVHRDYHSRNLMVTRKHELGVIDYQDAVTGPITYDLVSLLRDCYIKWPQENVQQWLSYYLDQLNARRGTNYSSATLQRWFDLMGMQRHLKAAGIFARLSLRDGKHDYLKDIPRTVSYLVEVSASYPEFCVVHDWLKMQLTPQLARLQSPVSASQETPVANGGDH